MIEAVVSLFEKKIGTIKWVEIKQSVDFYRFTFINNLPSCNKYKTELFFKVVREIQNTNENLTGLFTDSLPDKFGTKVMNTWLICREIQPKEINPVDRLKLIGKRGMGALEYEPSELIPSVPFREMKIGHLVQITNKTFNQNRDNIEQKDLDILFLVGTSAGGARAKAILLWNPKTNRFYTDKNPDLSDLEHWLIKFDGIHNNRDKDQADPQGYGRIEYAYHLLALEAVIKMTPCRLYHEGGRSHFMTKRFDRTDDVGKLQMQTLGGLAGFDYNQPDKYSYETGGNETRIHQIQKTYRLSLLE